MNVVFRRLLLLLLLTLIGLIGGIYVLARWLPLPPPYTRNAPSNLILDRQGHLLYEWVRPDASPYRPVSLEEIPMHCIHATLAAEDQRFYHHPGVDPIAILRSLYRHFRYNVPLTGASTLTQQWVRMRYLSPQERYQHRLSRKIKEAWLAFQAERHMSKQDILTAYFNTAYYGNFAVGIEAAAHAYFGQPVRTLDLAQCALLAGLPQAPAALNPLVYPHRAKERQTYVLQRMKEEGWVTPEEVEQVQKEPLVYTSTPFNIEAPHFVSWVQTQVENYLGVERVRAGGLVITTTLDLNLQHQVERALRQQLNLLKQGPFAPANRKVENGAAVVLDVQSGNVLAMVGSPNYFDEHNAGAVNGTLILRQPGSAIKPFVYAAAFSPDLPHPWAPPTLVRDARTVFRDREGKVYVPQNYDLQWHGIVSVRVALGASFNIPAVKALQHTGIERFLDLAKQVGLGSLLESPGQDLALALGAGEVSLLELTRAYGILARGGTFLPSRGIKEIRTVQGRPVWIPPKASPRNVMNPGVAYLITDILSDRYARIPTFGFPTPLDLSRPAAVKTGTTTDWRDAWTIGYTPDLVVGVWIGNWDNTPMEHLSGAEAAAPLWHAIMEMAHKGMPEHAFVRPPNVRKVRLCAETGLPATKDCGLLKEDVVLAGVPYALAESAGVLEEVRRSIGKSTPPESPPSWPTETVGGRVELVSPEPGATYILDPDIPAEEQEILLEIRAPEGSQVRCFVDGEGLEERTRLPYRWWWQLQGGDHAIHFVVRLPDNTVSTVDVEIHVINALP